MDRTRDKRHTRDSQLLIDRLTSGVEHVLPEEFATDDASALLGPDGDGFATLGDDQRRMLFHSFGYLLTRERGRN